MKTIERNQMIAEELIREHIRKRIKGKLESHIQQEYKLRKVVRKLLEAEAGTEEPSEYTGINVLADLLERIVPVFEDDYKMLTTSPEQRESFRNHIIHAVKNSLKPIESSTEAEKVGEHMVFEIDKNYLAEKMKIDLDSEDDMIDPETVSGEFIDIDSTDEDEQFVQIQDQNETGRNFAAATFKKVEKQIIEAYDMLADEEDQKLFYDYLLTNLLLYFDKFEDELSTTLPDTTTPEYEKKQEEEGEEELSTAEEDSTEEDSVEDLFS